MMSSDGPNSAGAPHNVAPCEIRPASLQSIHVARMTSNKGIACAVSIVALIVCSVVIGINTGGDAGGDSPPGPSPSPSGPKSVPADPREIASQLNSLYMGYDPNKPTSPLGVTIQMHDTMVFYCGGQCFSGEADCRVSTSLINHLVMISQATGSIAGLYAGRGSGIVFNQTAVETKLAKCSYMFDGATFNRLNGGCGCGAGGKQDCKDPWCAYDDIDPETGKKATGSSHHVTRCHCGDPDMAKEPHSTLDQQCYWKGPAFYPAGGEAPDETSKMVAQRIANQKGVDPMGAGQPDRIKNEYNNEIVLDANVVLSELQRDPASVISTFFYLKGSAAGKLAATKMSQQMAADYGLSKHVPVVALDTTSPVATTRAPFIVEDDVLTQALTA